MVNIPAFKFSELNSVKLIVDSQHIFSGSYFEFHFKLINFQIFGCKRHHRISTFCPYHAVMLPRDSFFFHRFKNEGELFFFTLMRIVSLILGPKISKLWIHTMEFFKIWHKESCREVHRHYINSFFPRSPCLEQMGHCGSKNDGSIFH